MPFVGVATLADFYKFGCDNLGYIVSFRIKLWLVVLGT